jgi:hypothetical protein
MSLLQQLNTFFESILNPKKRKRVELDDERRKKTASHNTMYSRQSQWFDETPVTAVSSDASGWAEEAMAKSRGDSQILHP